MDGEIPYLPWARASSRSSPRTSPTRRKPEYIEPLARCAPAGVPKSLYWHGYEIRQYPERSCSSFDSGYRLIHLDSKRTSPANIKLWNGDSRGHWEGNTLVVDVANNNSKALFDRYGNFASENVKITERYIFDKANKRLNYVATFDDPTVYTEHGPRPFRHDAGTSRMRPTGWHYKVTVANLPGQKPSA